MLYRSQWNPFNIWKFHIWMFCPTQTATGTNIDALQRPAINHIGCICNLSGTFAVVRHGLEGIVTEQRKAIYPLSATARGLLRCCTWPRGFVAITWLLLRPTNNHKHLHNTLSPDNHDRLHILSKIPSKSDANSFTKIPHTALRLHIP